MNESKTNDNSVKTSIIKKYLSGERNFSRMDLSWANLKNIDLRGVDLSNSDLSFANLENADLKGANLYNCNLKCANLRKADLSQTTLRNTDLSYSKLHEANLTGIQARKSSFRCAHLNEIKSEKCFLVEVDFSQAFLNGADLSNGNLKKVTFHKTFLTKVNLTKTHLSEVDLSGACLTGAMINQTYFKQVSYDRTTTFDKHLNPVREGMIYLEKNLVSLGDLLTMMNQISKTSQRYLGLALVSRYWQSSKPQHQWFNQFQIKSNGEIVYHGEKTNYLDDFQLHLCRQWLEKYYKNCSTILDNFQELTEEDLTSFPSPLALVAA